MEGTGNCAEKLHKFYVPADFDGFLNPVGIVVVGNIDPSPEGRQRLKDFGFPIAYVHPSHDQTPEIPVYRSLAELPMQVDLAIIRVSPRRAIEVVAECGANGIGHAVVFSNGFSEIGAEGEDLELELLATARKAGVRLIGPNTPDTLFERHFPLNGSREGLIGLVTQSGAAGRAIVQGTCMGAGFARWISTGNEADIEAADVLCHYALDPQVKAVAAYIEGFRSIPKLRHALTLLNENDTPLVVIKLGETEAGERLAASHTGHLAGSDRIIEGLLRQHGAIRVRDIDELLETASLLAKVPRGTGNRFAFYSSSGGAAALMAENAALARVPMPALHDVTQRDLAAMLPPHMTVGNPVDNGGLFLIRSPQKERFAVLDRILADDNIDVLIVGIPGAPDNIASALYDTVCQDIHDYSLTSDKPIIAVWNSFRCESKAYATLVAAGVPVFRSSRAASQALRALGDYGIARVRFRTRGSLARPLGNADEDAFSVAGAMTAEDAAALLSRWGVPFAREMLAKTGDEARALASGFGGRVVAKIASPDFPHKSDAGLVVLGIQGADEASQAFDVLVSRARLANPEACIDGVTVQEQIAGGIEMILGLVNDPHSGMALTIGMGGIHAEIARDAVVCPLPLDKVDIREMIDSLRMRPLLDGVRGSQPADIEGLVDVALKLAAFGESAGSRVRELDINPLIVLPDRVVAVDALIVTESTG